MREFLNHSVCPSFLNRSLLKFGLRVGELLILAVVYMVLDQVFDDLANKFYWVECPTLAAAFGLITLNRLAEDNFVQRSIAFYSAKRRLRASLLAERS